MKKKKTQPVVKQYAQCDAVLFFKNYIFRYVKISAGIYIKLLTAITFRWRDLDFLLFFFVCVSVCFFDHRESRKRDCAENGRM